MTVVTENFYQCAVAQQFPVIVVNGQDEIVFLSGAASKYFGHARRPSSMNALASIHASLRLTIGATLVQARQLHCEVHSHSVELELEGQAVTVQITAKPLDADSAAASMMVVLFKEAARTDPHVLTPDEASNAAVISELYADLMRSRNELHQLAFKYEETAKNLTASNEELYSINEELRAASGELVENRDLLEKNNAALKEMVDRVTAANDDLENFIHATELALIFVDRQLRILRYTPPAAALFNLLSRDLGRPLLDITHSFDDKTLAKDIERALQHGNRTEREIRGNRENWFSLRIVPYQSKNGKNEGVVLTFTDISLRKEAERKALTGEERWKVALEASGDGVWDWDVVTNRARYSPAWCKLTGYDCNNFNGEAVEQWEELIHPEDRDAVVADLKACAAGEPGWFSHEYRLRCKDSHWKWVLSRGAVVERDRRGHAVRIVGTISDISQKKMSEHQIWYRANYDNLTGLPNRNFFLDRLDYEVRHCHRAKELFAVLFIDLDHFKEVNDLHGHDVGDLLLKAVAEKIKSCVRESDTVARLGGDEFTVILTGTNDVSHVELIAEDILQALSQPIDLGGHLVHISGSIGLTLYPKDADTAGDLIRNADQAMYVAKNAGRNCCRFFCQAMQDAAISRISIIHDLHKATPGQLTLCFQPIVDMQSGRIMKAEALLRWRHPTRGLVLPDEFIHLAEEAGLISKIGDWVLSESACWALRFSKLVGKQFQISINKSPLEFSAAEHLPTIDWVAQLDQIGLDKASMVIEITEGMLLHATSQVQERIAALREAGIQFALDDFGTGYSSMSYLTKHRVDYLKIDQSFASRVTFDPACSVIVESMIVLAHKLGLKVIAEGIESKEQHDWLLAAGCDYSQGFFYSSPVEPVAFEELIHGNLSEFPAQ
jgi:diguanylate cyclase (GGDEF)-like protein/PAS domain S-box-containing protein